MRISRSPAVGSGHAAPAGIMSVGHDGRGSRSQAGEEDGETSSRPAGQVLIVEDELLAAWHVEMIVTDLGYEVCGIESRGEDAVRVAAKLEPDVILMDVNLGSGLDGVETARQICAAASVPVVFITAYSDTNTRQRINNAVPGAAILAKPVSPEAIRAALSERLGPGGD